MNWTCQPKQRHQSPGAGEWIDTDAQAAEFLSTHPSVTLHATRKGKGWVACVSGTTICPMPHSAMSKSSLHNTLLTRYLATTYGSGVYYINLYWAKDMPNWAGKYGALPELASAILRAERLMAPTQEAAND